MRSLFILMMVLLLTVITGYGQVARKVLPRSVNIVNKHTFAPSLSADGSIMIYMSTYSADGKPALKYAYKTKGNDWSVPEDIEEVNKNPDLNLMGGYALSADGKTVYFTSKRGQGIGEYDILYTEKKGGYWTPSKNVGKPVNSSGNDGAPSISPDGQFLYFMRCDQMNKYEAKGCEIWVAKRRNKTLWENPVKLPSPVNTGNDQFPKVFPDNNSLVFSSSRPGGKGGLDFYFTKKQGDRWIKPKPMTFLNSDKDEVFTGLTGKHDEIYFSTEYRGTEKIIKSKLPSEFQGDKVIIMNGLVVDDLTEKPIKAFIQVYDAISQKRVIYSRTKEDGSFSIVFPVGTAYDFSIQSLEKGYQYDSKLYFKDSLNASDKQKQTIRLSKITDGMTSVNNGIYFDDKSTELAAISKLELKRIVKILKDNPGFNLEIGIHSDKILQDSIRSNDDLTEVRVDTVYDYSSSFEVASTDNDTTYPPIEDIPDNVDLDSLNNSIPHQPVGRLMYTYHNDRTKGQAENLRLYLSERGVPDHRVNVVGYGDEFMTVPSSAPNHNENNRIEIKYIRK